jgi:superfamily II DNA or RNA helicase
VREKAGNPISPVDLYIELSRVYKTSRAKLPVFRKFLREHPEVLERCIVFVETQEYGELVQEIIHVVRPDFHSYYAGEDAAVLERFAKGKLECLITCHRLSEGIDIQSLRSVIIFSAARAKLETIQRIGRCLRTDPKDPHKVATIVDFIREEEDGLDPEAADNERQEWLTALSRIREEKIADDK